MADALTLRKRQFKAALALAGMTVMDFARVQGISQWHVYKVLSGRESGRLETEIEAFIAKWVPQNTLRPESAQGDDQ